MKNYILVILISSILIFSNSCKDPGDSKEFQRAVANSVFATFEDGSGFFNPETSFPYGDTIKFVFSTHFPPESDNLIDITQMRLGAYSPVSVILPESNTTGLVNLMNATTLTLVHTDGTQSEHTVIGEIRKSSEKQILDFHLPSVNLAGYLLEKDKIVGLIPSGVDISNQIPDIEVSPHATISPDPNLPQDFTQPVTYTITAENGTQVDYVVKSIVPEKIPSGIRKGSEKLLWSKRLADYGISEEDHKTTAVAVSGDYLVINTRDAVNKYVNRYTGELVGELEMGGTASLNFRNFFAANDSVGNILITNLANEGQDLFLYKWNSPEDPEPEKFIQWTSDLSGSQVGRSISIRGNLDEDAQIYMTASMSNNTILKWEVIDGELTSQIPEKFRYPGSGVWSYIADACPYDVGYENYLFVSGFPGDFGLMDMASNEVIVTLPIDNHGYTYNHNMHIRTFNNVPYLAAINSGPYTSNAFLYDASQPESLALTTSDDGFDDVRVFQTNSISSTVANWNGTGTVVLKVSDDGYKMIMYQVVTNGGIEAYEFDCIDINSFY